MIVIRGYEAFFHHALQRRIRERCARFRIGGEVFAGKRRNFPVRFSDEQRKFRRIAHRALGDRLNLRNRAARHIDDHFIFELLGIAVRDRRAALHVEIIISISVLCHRPDIPVLRGERGLRGAVVFRDRDDGRADRKRCRKRNAQTAHAPLHDLRFRRSLFRALPEPDGQEEPVHGGHEQVHEQYRERGALGISAEPSDDHGDDAQPERIEDTIDLPLRRGGVIGRHEKGAEKQTARKNLQENFLRAVPAEERHHRRRQDIYDGNAPVDHLSRDQVYAARKNGELASLPYAPADTAEKQLQNVAPIPFNAEKAFGKRGRAAAEIGGARRAVSPEDIAGNVRPDKRGHRAAVCEQ